MPAQNRRSVPGLLYLIAVRDDRCEQEHGQEPVDIDPPLVSYRHVAGYLRSPGNLASRATRTIGQSGQRGCGTPRCVLLAPGSPLIDQGSEHRVPLYISRATRSLYSHTIDTAQD